MSIKVSYVSPRIQTIGSAEIVRSLGPVSAGSTSEEGPCKPTGWMGDCPNP